MTETVFVDLLTWVEDWSTTLVRQRILDPYENAWAVFEMMHQALSPENLARVECPILRARRGIYAPIGYLKRSALFWVLRVRRERQRVSAELLGAARCAAIEATTEASAFCLPYESLTQQERVFYVRLAIARQPPVFQQLARRYLAAVEAGHKVEMRRLFAGLPYRARWCYERIWPAFCKSMRIALRRLAPNQIEDLIGN